MKTHINTQASKYTNTPNRKHTQTRTQTHTNTYFPTWDEIYFLFEPFLYLYIFFFIIFSVFLSSIFSVFHSCMCQFVRACMRVCLVVNERNGQTAMERQRGADPETHHRMSICLSVLMYIHWAQKVEGIFSVCIWRAAFLLLEDVFPGFEQYLTSRHLSSFCEI